MHECAMYVPLAGRTKGSKWWARSLCVFLGLARTIYIYTVYIRYYWQGNHQMYGHIQCIYTVLANTMCFALRAYLLLCMFHLCLLCVLIYPMHAFPVSNGGAFNIWSRDQLVSSNLIKHDLHNMIPDHRLLGRDDASVGPGDRQHPHDFQRKCQGVVCACQCYGLCISMHVFWLHILWLGSYIWNGF